MKANDLYGYCKTNGITFLPIFWRHLWLRLITKQNVVLGRDVILGGMLRVKGRLMIGMDNSILSLPRMRTWI